MTASKHVLRLRKPLTDRPLPEELLKHLQNPIPPLWILIDRPPQKISGRRFGVGTANMISQVLKFNPRVLTLIALAIPWSSASPVNSKRDKTDHGAFPFSPGFPIEKVSDLAVAISSHSWEFGTATEALLELYDPGISVFGDSPFHSGHTHTGDEHEKTKAGSGKRAPAEHSGLPRGLAYAAEKIVLGTGVNALADGDGAVGDPASLGVGAVLLGKRRGFEKYAKAAKEIIDYLLYEAPRASNGAISHRVDIVEPWLVSSDSPDLIHIDPLYRADFLYMAPPFMAYYAADTDDIALLREAVAQCERYREILQLKTSSPHARFVGLWQHILGPQNNDPGLWSTGNAWAAAGMTRVLATVLKAPICKNKAETRWRGEAVAGLTLWIKEIVDGAIGAGKDAYEDGLVKNYFDKPEMFGETSGSTLLAATVYRMVILSPGVFGRDKRYLHWADGIRKTLGGDFFDKISGETLSHVDAKNGTVRPAVNPLGWGDEKPWMTGSPEGQSFGVLLYAAWRDCVMAGRCSKH
ncbi:hypothetical protein H0H81_001261 [Sphagnurus paluster]|uniref:Uncharacterized protein n=1 Tax=Sphagnurus paluster TaxID=117069 RepID=A0A9P7GNH3_9AGAR|nr:hypothetical protein H0H81_001261 [Sphagnurus paluster]